AFLQLTCFLAVQEMDGLMSPLPAHVNLSLHLMTNYNKGLRPVKSLSTTTTVYIDIILYAILGVDEKNQMLTTYIWYNQSWVDEFLTWDPNDFENVTQISLPTACIWNPDIFVIEFVDAEKSPDIPYVYLNHEGRVFNNKPIQIVTSCSLNIYYFPFDIQNCTLTFTSWIHPLEDINVSVWKTQEEMKKDKRIFKNEGEWELLYVLPQYNEFKEMEESYGEIKFHVIIKRRPLFYVANLMLPSMFLMVMDLIGYYLPPECGERISFKITLLLGYSVFLIIVSDTLPATSTGTPLIAVYFVVCMALLVISLSESIFVVRMVEKRNLHSQVPEWLRKLVMEKIRFFLCIRNPNQFDESCAGNELTKYNHISLEDDKRSSVHNQPLRESHAILEKILREVASLRNQLEKHEDLAIVKQWLQVVYVLDTLLFRLYLLAFFAYVVSLSVLWSHGLNSNLDTIP
uniref:5-hydroxytryptamine receptor 3A n=1 Tax=Leptobrachium leishanense TaxID=445787 RepID=A0A8C5PW07_9ANUR